MICGVVNDLQGFGRLLPLDAIGAGANFFHTFRTPGSVSALCTAVIWRLDYWISETEPSSQPSVP